jgi:signal transduction histidine kinase/DNA-binding response OmpR family regulator/Tfp pilus assembly protein PilF
MKLTSMKNTLLFLLFFLSTITLNAQTSRIDSLEKKLYDNATKDTSRVNTLNEIAHEYRLIDNERLFEFANQAIVLSDSLDYDMGRLKSLNLLGVYYWTISNYQKALNLHEQALAISERINYAKGQSESHYYIGKIYREKGNYSRTLNHHRKALEIQKFIGDSSGMARIYNSIGIVYRIQGDYPKALEFCQKSLRIKKQIGDKYELSNVYNNIGSIYYFQNNYPKALEYYNRSLKISEEINDEIAIVTSYNNLGILYFYQDQYEKALDFFKRALSIQEEIDDKTGKAISYINIGEIYVKQNKLNEAWDYYYRGLKLSTRLEIKSVEGWSNWGLGVISGKKDEMKKAYNYSQKAYQIGKDIGEIELVQLSAEILSRVSAELGLYKEAYNLHKVYKEISDSIQNEENTRKIIGLEYEYKYQAEKEKQEKREALQRAKFQKQQLLTIIFIISSVLMIVLVFFIFRNYKRKQKDYNIISGQKEEIRRQNENLQLRNKEISEQNEKINQQKKQLVEQANKLSELDEIKSRFFTNISHEFRTPLTLILGPLEQLLNKTKEYSAKKALNLIYRNANKLLTLINQLLEISKIEKGSIKLKLQKCDIVRETRKIVEMFSSLASEKNINLQYLNNKDSMVGYLDKEKFDKILFNLLSNAFKHTSEGEIKVSLTLKADLKKIQLVVQDTGVGIQKEKLPYIFDRFYQVENSETEKTAGTGIGLSLIKELVQLYRGEITADSEPGKGTRFTVELPVSLDLFEEEEYELVSESLEPDFSVIQEENEGTSNIESEHNTTKNGEVILIVEDQADLREFIATNLSKDYRILEASDGEEGISKATKEIPDLIITDVMMPKVDGNELTRSLKNNENTSHIPIIMLTAKSSVESKIEGLENEADDYLTKPFNITELQLRIKNILKSRHKLQEKYNKSITVNPSEITTTSVDEKFLSKLLKIVEDNMSNSGFSVEFLCDAVGMSRANIHKKLKQLLNQSATEFINSVRLKRAAQLIRKNTGNISEIAYDVGYNNLSYFSRAFKKHFNMTPKEMMEKNK